MNPSPRLEKAFHVQFNKSYRRYDVSVAQFVHPSYRSAQSEVNDGDTALADDMHVRWRMVIEVNPHYKSART
jgi:hypothetical protein